MSKHRKAPRRNGQAAPPTSISMDQTVNELRASMGWQPANAEKPTKAPRPTKATKPTTTPGTLPSYPLSDSAPPVESRELIPDNIMDLLVEKYTRFAQLMARGKLQPMDIKSVRAICNQVDASAEDLEREARKRRWIAEHIRKSIDLVTPNRSQLERPTNGQKSYSRKEIDL